MSTADKLLTIAENVPKVYNAGYKKGKSEGGDNTVLDSIISKTLTHLESTTATAVGAAVFSDFTPLQSVNLPLAETIGNYSFRRCSNLSSVNLPNAKTIGLECFYDDTLVTYIDLPSVTKISRGVFNRTGLSTLIIRTPTVCILDNSVSFNSSPIANGEGYIYVPDELVDSYKSATNWSTYADQIKGISELEVSE